MDGSGLTTMLTTNPDMHIWIDFLTFGLGTIHEESHTTLVK